jgi:predicted RNase H-like HicB family nuclease
LDSKIENFFDFVVFLAYNLIMKNVIQFIISPGQDGYYVAEAVNLPIITQGKTLDDCISNVKEAVSLFLEETKEIVISKNPSIFFNMEIPIMSHA